VCSTPSGNRTRASGVRDRRPRPLDDRGKGVGGCDGWDRTSVVRVTTGRPTVERRRIELGQPEVSSELVIETLKERRPAAGSSSWHASVSDSRGRRSPLGDRQPAQLHGRPGPDRTGARGFEAHCSAAELRGGDGGSRTRTCGRRSRLRASNALPFQLGHASKGGRRGNRTPKARGPTRFRDGVPRPWQSFHMVTPAGFEPALPRVRAGSSPLSYGVVRMWSAGIEPATPRVSGGRSTG
jgi:hypothetical protein